LRTNSSYTSMVRGKLRNQIPSNFGRYVDILNSLEVNC
jgi:hypothetical protein